MNMLKRTLAMMLVLCMMLSAVPFTAFATESTDVTSEPTEAVIDAPTSEPTVPETSVPETSVPETSVPETSVPETSVPETSVPETTAPETEPTVPETTAPETEPTVPEKTRMVKSTSNSAYQRILHLDCGRKYFTADWIKALITEMSAAGYTHLQLAFGNDGMRFLLDDMSVTVNGTTYGSDAVKAGIQAGNKTYYNAGDKNELTQTEMDDIIKHAKAKNIQIVPHMNMPGHMDAILDAIEYVGISNAHFTGNTTSARSLNLNNDTAVAFTKALLAKYVAYFDEQGCGYFHIGADEFANDAYGNSMGFPSMGSTLYTKFAKFVNDCATIVKNAGMTPRAWNDGISYTGYSDSFDTDIQITYWSPGWWGYNVASASTLAANHDMINTHGGYYYILGVDDCFTSGTSTSHVGYNYTAAESFSNTTFNNNVVISNPIGSMFCIWCDVPGAETETEVAKYVRPILRVMAARMDDSSDYEVDTIVEGGFNADGTINEVIIAPDPVPDVPEDVGTLTDNGVTVSVAGLTGLTVTPVAEAELPTVEGATAVLAWDMTPVTEKGNYTGSATVSVPVPSDWSTVRGGVEATANGEAVSDITGTLKDGVFTFTVPHFSTVYAYNLDSNAVVEDIITSNGQTSTGYVLDTDGIINTDTTYLIVNTGSDGTGYALTNKEASSGAGSTPVQISNGVISVDDDSAIRWTFSGSTSGYLTNVLNGTTYYVSPWYNTLYIQNYLDEYCTLTFESVDNGSNGEYRVYLNYGNYCHFPKYTDSTWGSQGVTDKASIGTVYLYAKGSVAGYTVDATLQESRIAQLIIENSGYADESWEAYQAALNAAQEKLAEVEAATYSSEPAAQSALNKLIALVDALEAAKNALAKAVSITIKYQTEDGTLIKQETVTVADNATTYAVSNFTHTNGKYYAVNDPKVTNGTLAITPATVTEYTVIVEETEENLEEVTPLTVEYWQTNTQVVDGVGSTTCTRDVTAAEAYSENGIAVITLVPEDTYTKSNNKETDPQVNYWRSRLLNRSTNEQSPNDGDDETLNGTGFTKIRYWNGDWAVYTDANEWFPVENLAEYQFVLYFMNDMNLADEVSVGTSDWGKKGDGTMAGQYLGRDHVSIAFQVVYEDGTTSPVSTSAADLDSFTYLVDNWGNRGVGTIALNQIGDYQIWKVTAETGTHTTNYTTYTGNEGNPAYVTNFVWDKNEMTVWEDAKNPVSHYTILNPAGSPSKEGAYANLTWDEEDESILIRIYIKTVQTEDSLKVVYYDEKFGDTLYEYYISVAAGDNFTDDIGKYIIPTTGDPYIDVNQKPGVFTDDDGNTDPTRINVTDFGITNALPKAQRFETVLTQVPDAKGKYSSELYTYTGSEIKDDGKTLYLYYNIDTEVLSPNFVVDFGLPITFNLSDVVKDGINTVESVTVNEKTRYGTLAYNASTKVFTYTPTSVLANIDVLTITIKFAGEEASTTNVGVTPATTVFYEESFLDVTSGWSTPAAPTKTQATEVLGDSTYYGYDVQYAGDNSGSNGTSSNATAVGATTSFTFTGTGFDLYANCTTASGYVAVQVRDAQNNVVKMYTIDTVVDAGDTPATAGQSGDEYHLPIVSEQGLTHGTYTVTVRKIVNDSKTVKIDGVRIFNTLKDTTVFEEDHEDRPAFYQLRDSVLKAINITDETSVDYADKLPAQVYEELVAGIEAAPVAVVTDGNKTPSDIYGENTTAQDLLDNGPKNELFLYPGQTLTFKVTTERTLQIGLKSPLSAGVNYTLAYTVGNDTTTVASNEALNTCVDMFYALGNTIGTSKEYTITVTNSSTAGSNKILSVTDLKICDDPSFAFVPLTVDDIAIAMGVNDEPEVPETPVVPETPTEPSKPTEPTEPSKPTEPEVEETKPSKPGNNKPGNNKPGKPSKPNKPGKDEEKADKVATLKVTYVSLFGRKVGTATLTKEGTGRCTFSAAEIRAAAPAGRRAIWVIPTMINYGTSASIVVPVI